MPPVGFSANLVRCGMNRKIYKVSYVPNYRIRFIFAICVRTDSFLRSLDDIMGRLNVKSKCCAYFKFLLPFTESSTESHLTVTTYVLPVCSGCRAGLYQYLSSVVYKLGCASESPGELIITALPASLLEFLTQKV